MSIQKESMETPDQVLEEEKRKEGLDPEYKVEDDENDDDSDEVKETDAEILEMANAASKRMSDHWNPLYKLMEKDWSMYTLDGQWDEESKNARKDRPMLTMDISRKYPKAIVAETFRNPPGVKLSARKEGASKKAQAIADAIRYFEDRSGAKYAYSFSKESAAVGGLGWVKIGYEEDPQQESKYVLKVERVDDPLSIMIDECSFALDGSDKRYAQEDHGKEDGKRIWTYWWKDKDGKVKWALILDDKTVKDKGVFPSSKIPLVPNYGEMYRIAGKRKMFGVIRGIADAQKGLNYVVSEGIERMAMTPKPSWQIEEGSVSEQYEDDYDRSMTEAVARLYWKAKDESGHIHQKPTRGDSNPEVIWLPAMMEQFTNAARETTGIYQTEIGRDSNVSGKAREIQAEQGDRGQLVYDEHMQITVKESGVILLDLLHNVIGVEGMIPTLSEDGTMGMIELGKIELNEETGELEAVEDLDPKGLEISVSSAPAHATRKKEGQDKVKDMLQYIPPEKQSKIAEQVIRDMDFPGAEKYANAISPEGANNSPEAMEQTLAQMQAALEQSQAQAAELANNNQQLLLEIQNNTQAVLAKAQMDNQTDLAKNEQNNQTKLMIESMKIAGGAESDEKKMATEEYKQSQENLRKMADITSKANSENKEIMVKAVEKQSEEIQNAEFIPENGVIQE